MFSLFNVFLPFFFLIFVLLLQMGVVSYWGEHVHTLHLNRLSVSNTRVSRLTNRPDMTLKAMQNFSIVKCYIYFLQLVEQTTV